MTASTIDQGTLNTVSGGWSESLIPSNYSRYSERVTGDMDPAGICMHNTANSAPAKNEIANLKRPDNTRVASFHLAVDDKEAIMAIPFNKRAIHAGKANSKYIGIEIAQSTNYAGDVFEKAEKRAAIVVAKICQQYGWGTSQIKAHRDFTGKNCPHRTTMPEFLSMVQQVLSGKAPTGTTSGKTSGDEKPAQKPQTPSSGGISVGSKVKVTAARYATGQTVPGWVKANTYTVTQISGNRALLSDIISWVNLDGLAVQGGAPVQKTAQHTQPASGLGGLLASHPNVSTNQDLINLFYSMGGNNFNGAAKIARQYGVNINDLCANRKGKVNRVADSKPAPVVTEPKTEKTAGYVSGTGGQGLNVRSGAGSKHSRIGGLSEGQGVTILGSQNGWYIIQFGSGKGYVSGQYIKKGNAPAKKSGGNNGGGNNGGGAVSVSGVPLYAQGDSRWGGDLMGRSGKTIRAIGCAMTSTTMALNKTSGRSFTPKDMNSYLNKVGGYTGDGCIYWGTAAGYVSKSYTAKGYSKNNVDNELNAGRPVVISVKSANHWVCVAGREANGNYIIHDPAGGVKRSGYWSGGHIQVNGYSAGYNLRTFG